MTQYKHHPHNPLWLTLWHLEIRTVVLADDFPFSRWKKGIHVAKMFMVLGGSTCPPISTRCASWVKAFGVTSIIRITLDYPSIRRSAFTISGIQILAKRVPNALWHAMHCQHCTVGRVGQLTVEVARSQNMSSWHWNTKWQADHHWSVRKVGSIDIQLSGPIASIVQLSAMAIVL